MKVTIPSRSMHEGIPWHKVTVEIADTCPICGGPRGEPHKTISYDGSRRLYDVDGWQNPCGHVDYYEAVRVEAGVPAVGDMV